MKNKKSGASKTGSSCDITATPRRFAAPPQSVIRRHTGDFTWTGVRCERYKTTDEGWAAISRHVLAGVYGEKARFHVRYFEIAPRGYSSIESHRHEHIVICIRGKGRIIMAGKPRTLRHLDVAYIAPDDVHQLKNPYNEPFGFLCIVNARRDRPKPAALPPRARRHTAKPHGRRR